MKTCKLVFVGASELSKICLQKVRQEKLIDIVGVVSAPENFSISYSSDKVKNYLHCDLKNYSEVNNYPYIEIQGKFSQNEIAKWISDKEPDIIMVIGWYHMVPGSWRDIAPCFGLHASLLPRYAGGAPLVWAIINGERKTGVTIFRMDQGVDTGPIACQRSIVISATETIFTLYNKMIKTSSAMVGDFIKNFATDNIKLVPQAHENRSVMSQRSPSDGLIDFNKPVTYIERFVRAQTKPYPGAFINFHGSELKIWSARKNKSLKNKELGSIFIKNKRLYLSAYSGSLELLDVSYRGRNGSDAISLIKKKVINGI